MSYNPQALWDLSGPTALPSMSDGDFLQLLEKQMQAAHPTTGSPVNDLQSMYNPASLMVAPAALMGSAPVDSLTPPLTNESSPSPSASEQDNMVGDGTKRKAGRDNSRDGQPRAKVQHKATDEGVNSQPQDDATKKPPARRKSGSGSAAANSDEGRLAKRKEQNRAAQRAFRDRKEKHVKDLEDKIQELVQKFNTSESENTNLKDLLQRLQNENMVLKQSAFTFEFAPKDKSNHSTSPATNAGSMSSISTNPFTSPAQSSGSSASPESTTSPYVANSPPNSLFKQTPPPNAPSRSESQDQVGINSAGFAVFTAPASVQPTPATPALSMSSPGAGPSTISHNAFNQNSLFTSYRDPSSYSFGLPLGDFNTLSTPSLGAEFGMDFDMGMPMGSTDLGAFGLGSDFDDLFGGQLGSLDGTNVYGGMSTVTSPSASIPTPLSAAATPISNPVIIDGLPSAGESARVECSIKAPSSVDWRRCPKTKEEFVERIKKDAALPQSTFGPPVEPLDKAQVEQDWQQFTTELRQLKEPDMDGLCTELFDKAQCSELKTRMKQSMMRIAKDLASGTPPA